MKIKNLVKIILSALLLSILLSGCASNNPNSATINKEEVIVIDNLDKGEISNIFRAYFNRIDKDVGNYKILEPKTFEIYRCPYKYYIKLDEDKTITIGGSKYVSGDCLYSRNHSKEEVERIVNSTKNQFLFYINDYKDNKDYILKSKEEFKHFKPKFDFSNFPNNKSNIYSEIEKKMKSTYDVNNIDANSLYASYVKYYSKNKIDFKKYFLEEYKVATYFRSTNGKGFFILDSNNSSMGEINKYNVDKKEVIKVYGDLKYNFGVQFENLKFSNKDILVEVDEYVIESSKFKLKLSNLSNKFIDIDTASIYLNENIRSKNLQNFRLPPNSIDYIDIRVDKMYELFHIKTFNETFFIGLALDYKLQGQKQVFFEKKTLKVPTSL